MLQRKPSLDMQYNPFSNQLTFKELKIFFDNDATQKNLTLDMGKKGILFVSNISLHWSAWAVKLKKSEAVTVTHGSCGKTTQ